MFFVQILFGSCPVLNFSIYLFVYFLCTRSSRCCVLCFHMATLDTLSVLIRVHTTFGLVVGPMGLLTLIRW